MIEELARRLEKSDEAREGYLHEMQSLRGEIITTCRRPRSRGELEVCIVITNKFTQQSHVA